jgi:cytochrome c biogenesis protein CcdA
MPFSYFEIVLLYPIIVAVIAKFTLDAQLWQSIKNAYYLFIGYVITYAAIMFLLLSAIRFIDFFLNFVIFSIGYFLIFFIRAYIQTEQHDLFAAVESTEQKK